MQSDVNNRKNKDSVGSKVEVTESPNIFALVKTHKHTHTLSSTGGIIFRLVGRHTKIVPQDHFQG